jgi:hypothetical protein
MQLGDKTAFGLAGVGLGAAVIGMTVEHIFPSLAAATWHKVFWGGLALIALNVLYLVYLHFDWRRRLAPLLLMIMGSLMFFVGACWYGITFFPTREPNEVGANTATPKTPTSVEPEVNLLIECRAADLPIQVPPEAQVFTLPLFYSPGASGEQIGLSSRHGQPGTTWEWFPDLEIIQVHRCEITNYWKAPIFNVTMILKVDFLGVVANAANPGNISSGPLAYSREWPVLISKIDPGKNNDFVFYAYNYSKYFASVTLPQMASYSVLGDNTRQEAALVQIGMFAGMSFSPANVAK